MRLVRDRPPLYDEICKVFDVRGKPVLFAWGDVIYAPSGVSSVSKQVMAHESVHGRRQLTYIDGIGYDSGMKRIEHWWHRYLIDATFRLAEEKLGHKAEYEELCEMLPSRSDRRRHLSHVAGRLAAPLYRYAITKDEAKRFLGGE